MILIAPAPDTDYPVGDRMYRSDRRRIIRDVESADAVALLDYHCSIPPRAIMFVREGEIWAAHCFSCGDWIECPEEMMPWFWMKNGDISIDFPHYHRDHCDWVWTPPPRPKDLYEPPGGSLAPPLEAPAPSTTIIPAARPDYDRIHSIMR